ncbi:MAG: glycine cleavage system aminomethyltransferase GcvT [Limnohabitans sp.]|nr:glycine cleavage system aminomethyltransferase GcvT [Limnohabitans sp.]
MPDVPIPDAAPLLITPLNALHLELGARMVPFAGYSMPVQYPSGLMAEHVHTRTQAGLFDVSHMGQLTLSGPGAAKAFESLMPVDVMGLAPGRQRYGLLLNEEGGILDDLMFVNRGDDLFVVVNGACKQADIAHLQQRIGTQCTITPMPDQALLALQGPLAVTALARMVPGVTSLVFMTGARFDWKGVPLFITRSGYTGEDGFEISIAAAQADTFARALLAQPEVKPIGLGARNSLRLEAGLCLYGQDLGTTTSPVEAGLNWAIQKVRRTGGERAGGFPGAERVLRELAQGPERCRVGLVAQARVPVREHTPLQAQDGTPVGEVCSGLLGPTCNQPIAMAYVPRALSATGTVLNAIVRGKSVPMVVQAMPFVPTRYYRG